MKKLGILSVLLGMGLGVYASDISVPLGNLINDVAGMQNTNSQLRLLEDEEFRKREYNELQNVKNTKEMNNKLEQNYQDVQRQQQMPYNFYTQDIDFVKENGKIMIKRID